MLCEECQVRPATVYVTTIADGQRRDQHLCEVCARQKGEFDFLLEGPSGLEGMVAGLAAIPGTQGTVRVVPNLTCPQCGQTYDQFIKTSLLGCPACYEAFKVPLGQVIQRIQGPGAHTGKAPSRRGVRVRSQSELRRLKDELAQLVRREEYEKAAEVRDRIRRLEADAAADRGGEA